MKILIVDNYVMFHHSVVDMLEKRGHSVRCLTPMTGISGTNAEDQFKPVGHSLEWADVIVLQHNLPGDGHTPFTGEMWLAGYQHYPVRQKAVGMSGHSQQYLAKHLFPDDSLAHRPEAVCHAIETALN